MKELLNRLEACKEAVEWAGEMELNEVISECHRGDWLLWLAQKVGVDIRQLTLAKARCAKLVIYLMKDERSRKAVELAEQFGLGNATREELDAAAAAAAAAYDAAYDAAYAEAYADAEAAAYYAAYAEAAAYYAAYDAAAAAAKRAEILLQCADICREVFRQELINKVNTIK